MFARWKMAALAAAIILSTSTLHAQTLGTAFTYQGELRESASALANGNYDFQFALFDALIVKGAPSRSRNSSFT